MRSMIEALFFKTMGHFSWFIPSASPCRIGPFDEIESANQALNRALSKFKSRKLGTSFCMSRQQDVINYRDLQERLSLLSYHSQ